MKIAILGMGYVGCVTAAVLARERHQVTGIDVNAQKIESLHRGESPVLEPELPELIRRDRETGMLEATSDLHAGLAGAEVIFICVGTPSAGNGSLDSSHVERVATQIGGALGGCTIYPVVVLRSTVLPAMIEGVIVPALERASGRRIGEGFGFAINPEFLREGRSIRDFDEPEFTLVGTDDPRAEAALRALYAFLSAPVVVTDRRTAALVKYASNAFHALKVAFANEMGAVAEAAGADAREVMRVFCLDRKLNLSASYLRPGMPFGGSCLPKDLRAMVHFARRQDQPVPVLGAALESNRLRIEDCTKRILATGGNHIGVFGMAFKAGTDDVRESPTVAIIESLLGKGLRVAVYDSRVALAKLVGTNREYLARHVPHIATLLRPTLDEVIRESEVLVIGSQEEEFRQLLQMMRPEQTLIDLAGLMESPAAF